MYLKLIKKTAKINLVLASMVVFFTIMMPFNVVFADTIYLNDSSIIVGKIIEETRDQIVFANSYGTFKVKKKLIKKKYVSETVEKDIEIHKKLGKKVNVKMIEKNFREGLKIQKKIEKDKPKDAGELWVYGRLGFSISYFNTFMSQYSNQLRINELLKQGGALTLHYDQGLDMLIKKRKWYMPGLRVEFGYFYYSRQIFVDNRLKVAGYLFLVGPMWVYPSFKSKYGSLVFSLLPGIVIIDVVNKDTNFEKTINPFSIQAFIGYEYAFGKKKLFGVPTLFVHVRYNYIHDMDVAFHSIGGSIGLSFKLW